MKTRLLIITAAALLLIGAGPSASAQTSHHAAAGGAFVSLQVDQGKFRLYGFGLTPGSYVGVLLAYRDYGQTISRTARVNVIDGRIQTDEDSYLYEVDETGRVTVAGSIHLFTNGFVPGRLVAQLADTAGEMADAETDIGT